jgi:hypothetical protein
MNKIIIFLTATILNSTTALAQSVPHPRSTEILSADDGYEYLPCGTSGKSDDSYLDHSCTSPQTETPQNRAANTKVCLVTENLDFFCKSIQSCPLSATRVNSLPEPLNPGVYCIFLDEGEIEGATEPVTGASEFSSSETANQINGEKGEFFLKLLISFLLNQQYQVNRSIGENETGQIAPSRTETQQLSCNLETNKIFCTLSDTQSGVQTDITIDPRNGISWQELMEIAKKIKNSLY